MTADEPVEGRESDCNGKTCPGWDDPQCGWYPNRSGNRPASCAGPRSPSVPVESREQPRWWIGWCPHFNRPAGLASGNCTCVTGCFSADQEKRRANTTEERP